MNYSKFYLMLLFSFIIMYIVMFMNVDSVSDIYMSLTRLYMSMLMVSPMAIVMMLMMGKMYSNKKRNKVIIAAAVLIFFGSLFLLRTQTPIGDRQYMKAMISHHSSAIMTSKHADIQDSELRRLSEHIITSQKKEINEMKEMLSRLP